ncbi:thiopurine S-methyltransferase [Legionella lansingensis]|uniref:Thiopurine S-methyltransferase n=1 Tax=Legionella lansingensis TaxID=45067 RepID=A0A0W0V759_9GAMM|nr:thiopurine S-methyltransferase [Legionella lansingensis]KTD15969.1 thiopurine S-methyltransferase [Legionella lansingensis]SNV56615.1 thiopurine S-methyltransferase [Legionella lansingensis]
MKDFWLKIWQADNIPFHQDKINPDLIQYWPSLNLSPGAKVLVPLCGKSLDLLWLMQQGFHIIGIELSELAVQCFASENNLPMTKRLDQGFICYSAPSISIWVEDIFNLNRDFIGQVDAIYDRAALIAIPAKLRPRYIKTCLQWLAPQGKILLKTLTYEEKQMEGPPFSVDDAEVKALYSSCQELQCIKETSREVDKSDPLYARGLKQSTDKVWLIRY